ncbi:14186_t:CDS:1, partial [Racocetra fulgida]
ICRGLSISIEGTKGTKAELIQRIRDYSNMGNHTRSEMTEKSKRETYDVDKEDDSLCSEYPNEVNEVHEIHEGDPQIQSLRELVQKSRGKTKILRSRITPSQDEEGQSSQHQLMEDTYETLGKSR